MCRVSTQPIVSRKQVVDCFETIDSAFGTITRNLQRLAAAYRESEPDRCNAIMAYWDCVNEIQQVIHDGRSNY